MIEKICWGLAINNFVIKGHPTAPSSIGQRLPTKLVIKFFSASSLPAACNYQGSLILNLLYKYHQIFTLVMVDDVTIIQVGADIEFIGKIQNSAGNILGEVFEETETFVALRTASEICFEKLSLLSKCAPKCLVESSQATGIPLKVRLG